MKYFLKDCTIEDLEFNSNWKFQVGAALSHKKTALKIFCEIEQKPFFNSQYSVRCSLRSETISGNWRPLKNHEKCFLFHRYKSNLLLGNHILLILCILIKPNVWYLWSLKTFAIKRWFPFNFLIILQGCYFVVDGRKNFKFLANISFVSGLQNIVLPSLLLFLCACY